VKTSTQLGMLWVIGALCLAMIPQLAAMAPHLVLLAILPVAWRLAAEMRGWKPLPLLVRISITVFTVFLLVMTYGGLFGRRVAVSLLALMLSLKLLETFKIREARMVASLSLFLCATQFLFTQGILMLLYGAATLAATLVALVYLQRREAFLPVGEAPPGGRSMFTHLGYSARLMALAAPSPWPCSCFFRAGAPRCGACPMALSMRVRACPTA
jgi:hypothetical protein